MKQVPKTKAGKAAKVEKTMHEFGKGKLHSGSKTGPMVTNPKQAVAIALNQAGESNRNGGAPHSFKPSSGAHGYGHDAIQRRGSTRLSGHPGAHRIGGK